MIENPDLGKIKEDLSNDEKEEIFNSMVNYFELTPDNLSIQIPYNFKNALDTIDSLYLDSFSSDLKEIVSIKEKKSFYYYNEKNFSINNVRFLTSKLSDNEKTEYILLNDLKTDGYIKENPDYSSMSGEIIDTGMNIKVMTKEDDKKEIIIKCIINYKKFTENIINNLINKSEFEKAKTILQNSIKYKCNELACQNLEFEMRIFSNSINKVLYTDNGEYLFDLQFPPIFRTNFLIDGTKLHPGAKKNDYTYYENIMFPFRNFQDEIANLKYRHFYILVNKEGDVDLNKSNDSYNHFNNDSNEELLDYIGNLFTNKNDIIDRKKFRHVSKIKIIPKNEITKNCYKGGKYELSDYFRYNSDENICKILKELKFIRDVNDYLDYYDNKKLPLDEEVIKLNYQILALVSEGILSYYNAIEFIENILFQKKKDYRKTIFEPCYDLDFPVFFNLTLTKILNKFQNSLEEKNLSSFELILESTFKALYSEYLIKDMKEILRPSRNPVLKFVQRCVITPTYILFTPYILDQGNRILRDFIPSINLSMLCGFKMDNFEEGRWNNKFLIEYIKHIMNNGFFIGEKNFKFFNFSQSQFRNMSCWLLTDPEKILEQTGDYSNIKIVAKFGARISQTLTTTIKTVKIPKDHIKYIDDVLLRKKIKDDDGIEREVEYNFSDGVGKISFTLAKEIADIIHLKFVPSCFQGRFLGCKGVWTTMYNDRSGNIYIRPSQEKFKLKKIHETDNFFELCDYSRYIQAYLNRQVILLMRANGIEDYIFMKKLNEYKNRLEDEKFVLSLVHYNEWSGLFQYMNSCGLNRLNDRLMRSLLESNLQILYNDVKNKARIYIQDSAYVIGIMDEYGILEYGQAFLRIRRKNLDLTLNKKCTIAKCPCLHPGDIRVLDFKCYIEGDETTKKYKIFDTYENVLIFPSKGERPHPNECSGSDLDGDNYFIFYDKDLIVDEKKLAKPMNYSFSLKPLKKDNIQIKDVIEYFAEYTNLNNLGLIGDAHLALSDRDPLGARGKIPMKIARKFSRAVDAPKTGDEVILSEDEEPKKFPHYMCKAPKKTYISETIIGQLYDEINKTIEEVTKKKESNNEKTFYDNSLKKSGWDKFAILGLVFYRDFFEEILNLMKKNEIKGESVLLTGNNIDNDDSVFSKRKNNYDLREKISDEMRRLFREARNNFSKAIQLFFSLKNIENPILQGLNDEIFFKNNLNLFASACYIISYNFYDTFSQESYVDILGIKFNQYINESLFKDNEIEDLNGISEYECDVYGTAFYECQENNIEDYHNNYNEKKKLIKNIIEDNVKDMKGFVRETKRFKIPENPNIENQYRILSFPWCISGKLLSIMKFLNKN